MRAPPTERLDRCDGGCYRRTIEGEMAMGRFLSLALLGLILAGCVPIAHDPARDEFGVSTARPDAGASPPAADEIAKLDWKAGQICIRGYAQTQRDVEPAESAQQLIDMKLRCGHYDRLDFDYVHMDWSNLL
jgi:hypothetical protein